MGNLIARSIRHRHQLERILRNLSNSPEIICKSAILSYVLYSFGKTTMGNLIARQGRHKHQHERNPRNLSNLPEIICKSAILSYVLYSFGKTTMGNLIARQGRHQHQHERNLRNLSNLPEIICKLAILSFVLYSFGKTTMGNLITRQGRHQHQHERNMRNLSNLPEKCISAILSFTTPRDVCRLAAVSTTFRSAAYSDSVWNKFLPRQCYQILPKAVTPVAFASKRELYFRLCKSILIDGGTKIFWLERSTSKIGYMLSARAIWIIWSNDQRYWCWASRDESRFDEVAELLRVWWLELGGEMDCKLLSADTEYRVVFMLKLKADSGGWNGQTMQFLVTTPEGEDINSEQPLLETEWVANEGWMEVVAGEFTVRPAEDIEGNSSSSMSFRMKDISSCWKSGLLIDGVKIEPKST